MTSGQEFAGVNSVVLRPEPGVVVLGAGVIGLTTGIALLQAGHDVQIWAKAESPNTTSDVAAAFWYPFKAGPQDKVDRWAAETLAFARDTLVNNSATGCFVLPFHHIARAPLDDPSWAKSVPGFRHDTAGLPSGYVDSVAFETVVFDSSIYMGYLRQEFARLGGSVALKEVANLKEPLQVADVVVNCTGLASQDLANDETLQPSRGQVVVVAKNGFDKGVVLDPFDGGALLIVPRNNDIVVGATVQDGDSNLAVDPADTETMLARVRAVYPEYDWDAILAQKVGLRPARPVVRLEKEDAPAGKRIIHNYGHGGAGYTLSRGCAQEVVRLVAG